MDWIHVTDNMVQWLVFLKTVGLALKEENFCIAIDVTSFWRRKLFHRISHLATVVEDIYDENRILQYFLLAKHKQPLLLITISLLYEPLKAECHLLYGFLYCEQHHIYLS
jgi:hypothetical protein